MESRAKTLTLTAADAKESDEAYAGAHVDVAADFPVEVTDADITYWQGDDPVVGDLTATGEYTAKVTVGGVTAVATFKIFHEHDYKIEQTDDATLTATCQAAGVCNAKTRTLKLIADSRDWKKGTAVTASIEDGFEDAIAHTAGDFIYKQNGETVSAPKLTGDYTVEVTVTVGETPYTLKKAFSITKPAGGYTAGYEVKGADGEESKWLCYDTFADAVAAAEEKGTVVWHEGGDNLRQATFDFKSDKDITVDLNGKNFSYDSDGHVTIKNSGSGRVKLINGTLRTAGTITSWSHDIYLQGKLTLGEGISVVKYGDLSSAGLNIREGADIILAGGTYRGTIEIDANSKLAITGGKYNTFYLGALTATYIPELGDKYVVRTISEDGGNLVREVIPHEHALKYTVNGGEVTVVCEAANSDLCNYKPGNGAKLTLTAKGEQYMNVDALGATINATDNFPVKDLAIAYFDSENNPVADITTAGEGTYTAQVTVADGAVAQVSFVIYEKKPELSDVTFALANDSFAFDGAEHVNSIVTAQFGDYALTAGVDYTMSGDLFSQVGSPAKDETYTVTLTAVEGGKFEGSMDLSWTITTLGASAQFGTPEAAGGCGTVEGTTLTATPTKLAYADNAWTMEMTVAIPLGNGGSTYTFTPEALVRTVSPNVTVNRGDEISAGTYNGQYKAKSFTWTEKISALDVEAAIEAGEEKIVRTAKVYALAYEEEVQDWLGLARATLTNNGGLREVEFKMEIPLAGLVLPVPAGATLDMAGTKFASEDEYEDYPYQLQLGAGAKVYGDPEVDGGYIFNEDGLTTTVEGYEVTYVEIEDAQEGECAYYFTTLPINYNIGYSFVDTDGNTLTDVTNPYSGTKTYTVEDEVTFTEPATLDGYEFVGWSPAKIEKGSTGKQTITGTFKRSITPTAQVAEVTPAPEGLDVAATFTLGEYAANYRDWKADFILTADQNLAKDAITLKGEIPSQTTGWVPLALADDYTAGTPLSIIGLAMEKLPLALPVYYWELKDMGTFNCGLVANKIETETKVTVSLVLSKEGEDPMTLATFETTLQKTSTPYEDVVIDDTDDGKTVAPEVKQAAAAKVESLCGGDVANIAAVKAWVLAQGVKAADLAESIYTKASYDLGVALLDKGASVAKVAFDEVVEDSANGFSFKIEVQFEGEPTPEVVKATAAKVAGYIWTTGDLGKGFTSAIDASRVEIDLVTGKVTIKPDASKTSEFFKIVIPRD